MIPYSARGRHPLLVIATSVLLLNTLYLALFASPTIFYFSNVVLHIALGLIVGVMFARRLSQWWGILPLVIRAGALVFVGGLSFGTAILFLGAAGEYRWLLPTHIALTLVGGVSLLGYGLMVASRRATRGAKVAVAAARRRFASRARAGPSGSKIRPSCRQR
jgi:hypothetical protein